MMRSSGLFLVFHSPINVSSFVPNLIEVHV